MSQSNSHPGLVYKHETSSCGPNHGFPVQNRLFSDEKFLSFKIKKSEITDTGNLKAREDQILILGNLVSLKF